MARAGRASKAGGPPAHQGGGGHRPSATSLISITVALAAVWATSRWFQVGNTDGGVEDGGGSASQKASRTGVDRVAVSEKVATRVINAATELTRKGNAGEAARRLNALIRKTPPASAMLAARFELADALNAMGDSTGVERQLTLAQEWAKAFGTPAQRAESAWALAKLFLYRKGTRPRVIELLRAVLVDDPHHDNVLAFIRTRLDERSPAVLLSRFFSLRALSYPVSDAVGEMSGAKLILVSPDGWADAVDVLGRVRLEGLTDSNPLDTVMLLGQAHDRLGHLKEAEAAFGKAVHMYDIAVKSGQQIEEKIRFRYALSHYQLGKVQLLLGNVADCIATAQTALQKFPGVYHLVDLAGVAMAQAGRPKRDLLEHYTQAKHYIDHLPSEHRMIPERVLSATLARLIALGPPASSKKSVPREPGFEQPTVASDAQNNGGWPEVVLTEWESARCNIDRRLDLTPEEFRVEYADRNMPVIIPRALAGWEANAAWRRDDFVRKYGDHNLTVRRSVDIAFDNEFGGLDSDRMSVAEYVASAFNDSTTVPLALGEVKYVLGALAWNDSGFREDYSPPPHFAPPGKFAWTASQRDNSALAYLGPAGSGVTLHEHTNAWNALVYGRKRWTLLPPYTHYGPTALPVTEWLRSWYPKFQNVAFECTQHAGEILYVPTNWMHSVLNLQASIGVAVEVGHNTALLDRLLSQKI